MGLAFPLGLVAAALAGPLILLYVLKLRRRPVVVASTLPWRLLLADRRANAPWERLRRHLLLLLQLIILMLLVLAFAGPYLPSMTTLQGDSVIVLDLSASMGATTGAGRTRLDDGRAALRPSVASAERRRLALVLAGAQPRVVAPLSEDRAVLLRELAAARPTAAPADLVAALELAHALARGGGSGEVVLVTDGAFDAPPVLAALLARTRVVRAGDDAAPNAGIVSVALRPAPGSAGEHELFLGLAASTARAIVARVEAAAAVMPETGPARPEDWTWTPVASASVVPDPNGAASHLFRLSATPGTALRIRLDGPDALAADDTAHLIVPERPRRRVLLASSRPFLLERALAALPSTDLSVTAGEPGSAENHDVVVVDGPLPAVLPARPLLAFGGPAPVAGAEAGRLVDPRIVRWDARHPALRNVRLDAIRVLGAHAGPLPAGASALIESDQGPLAVTWPAPGGRALWFRFDLTETDLPLRVAFPVLLADALDWLTENADADGVMPAGRERDVLIEGSGSADLVLPDGRALTLRARAGSVRLPPIESTGIALIRDDRAAAPRPMAVALLSAEETDLAPRSLPVEDASPPDGAMAGPGVREPGRRPLWPLAVLLALGVLMAEWAVHHRRRE